MKRIAVMALISAVSFSSLSAQLEDEAKAGNIKAAYKLAQFYENNNDIKNTMHWYKQAAKLSMQNQGEFVTVKKNWRHS